MLEALQFVQGAVARKDFVPEMTHFHIKDGGVMTYNGTLTLYSPIALNFDVSPKAEPMIKAIQACKDSTITLHLTPSGMLSVKSGSFRALVDCLPTRELPLTTQPEGTEVNLAGKLLTVLRTLLPFVAEDASRPWARGVLFSGQFARATNNIIIVEHWMGETVFPVPVNLPKSAINEILRVKEEPEKAFVSETNITLVFPGGRWLKAQLFPTDWPDVQRVLGTDQDCYEADAITEEVWNGVEQILPLADKETCAVYVSADCATTHEGDKGAAVSYGKVFRVDKPAILNIEQFHALRGVAKTIKLSTYPKPCPFFGDGIRGSIIGIRQ